MPVISRFYWILIAMYYDDHTPAHFHAKYNEFEVQIGISDLRVIKGKLPPKALALTIERVSQHVSEFLKNREIVENGGEFIQIQPL